MEEEWRDIEGFEGYYQVSNLGRVRSNDRDVLYVNGQIHHYNRIIRKLNDDKDGYKIVHLCRQKKQCTKKVHQLVANAFIPNPQNLPLINHIDENKANNRVDNLEWCTVDYNNHYNDRYKKMKARKKEVVLFNVVTGSVTRYVSLTDAAKALNTESGAIAGVENVDGKTIKSHLVFSKDEFNGLTLKRSLSAYNKHKPRGIVVEFLDTEDTKFYTTENEFCRENNEYPGSVNRHLRNNTDVFNNKYVIRYALPFEEVKYDNGQLLNY